MQLTRFASVLKPPVTGAKCRVTTTCWNPGSVERGDHAADLEALHVDLHVETDAPPDALRNLIEMSERACYVLLALDRLPQPTLAVAVNGATFPL